MADKSDEEEPSSVWNVRGQHENRAFSAFKELRDNEELLDITLQVSNTTIQAHRVVLAACSPYFRAMLTTGFAETFLSTISLQECDPVAVQLIVDFFYSRNLTITQENIEGVLAVASLFEIPELVHECGEFIQGEIGIENCLGIQSLAGQFSLTALKSKVDNFVCWNFMSVSREEEFVLIPAEQLQDIIRQDTLHVNGEEDVFEAVMAWYEHDQERMERHQDIMSFVRFDSIDRQYLEEVTRDEDITRIPAWKTIVDEAFAVVASPLMKRKSKKRQSPNVLYLMGELYNEPVKMFDMETCSCTPVPDMKENVGTAVMVDNTLYMVIGGGLMVDRYNPKLNYWVRVADGFKEAEFVACGSPGRIYVLGGARRAKYLDLKSRDWVSLPLMSIRRSYHAVACLRGRVYVSGGVTPPGDQPVADAESFNPDLNTWEPLPPMNNVRFRHELVAFCDNIYAIGGCQQVGFALKSIELFNVKSGCWLMLQNMNNPRKDFAAGVVDGMMFVFGGGGTTTIEQYNRDADRWTVVGNLQKRWSNFRCVSHPFICFKQTKLE